MACVHEITSGLRPHLPLLPPILPYELLLFLDVRLPEEARDFVVAGPDPAEQILDAGGRVGCECPCKSESEPCSNRAQTFACQVPLEFSIIDWKPNSWGTTKTGATPRLRHNRLTRPITSGWAWVPWKIVSLSNRA